MSNNERSIAPTMPPRCVYHQSFQHWSLSLSYIYYFLYYILVLYIYINRESRERERERRHNTASGRAISSIKWSLHQRPVQFPVLAARLLPAEYASSLVSQYWHRATAASCYCGRRLTNSPDESLWPLERSPGRLLFSSAHGPASFSRVESTPLMSSVSTTTRLYRVDTHMLLFNRIRWDLFNFQMYIQPRHSSFLKKVCGQHRVDSLHTVIVFHLLFSCSWLQRRGRVDSHPVQNYGDNLCRS
jgi:hypothetical protein